MYHLFIDTVTSTIIDCNINETYRTCNVSFSLYNSYVMNSLLTRSNNIVNAVSVDVDVAAVLNDEDDFLKTGSFVPSSSCHLQAQSACNA